MTDGVSIDTSSFEKFALQMVEAARLVKTNADRAAVAGAEVVAAKARANASFSRHIPGTIRAQAIAGGAVVTTFGREAGAFEHHGIPGEFIHPVFGNPDVRVAQEAHPFMHPAAAESVPAVVELDKVAVETTFREVGFH